MADGWKTSPVIWGALTDNQPFDANPSVLEGFVVRSYSAVFYNRILLTPNLIDAGNVIAETSYVVTIFNAYFTPVTLTAINVLGDNGISISTVSLPLVFEPLEEIAFTITITTEGPPVINASYAFIFQDPTEDVTLLITGARIVLFPYQYRAEMNETLKWNSGVLNSYNGTEQRYRALKAPRQNFSAVAIVPSHELTSAENLLYGWRGKAWGIPVWSEGRVVTSPIAQNDTTISVNTQYGDFRVGGFALIWKNSKVTDIRTISALTTTTMSFTDGVSEDFETAIIAPLRSGIMTTNPVRRTSGTKANITLNFQVLDNTTLTSSNGVEPYSNGIEAFLDTPLLKPSFVDDGYEQDVEIVDFDTGVLEFFAPWTYTRINRQFNLLLEGLEDIWNFRLWLHRRAGKLIPFYMPTFENNLISSQVGLITNTLIVKNVNITNLATQRTRVAVKTYSAGWIFTEITSFAESFENAVLTLNPSINVDASDIDLISYVGLKRLSSDQISFKWLPNNVVEVTLPIVEISP